MPDEMLQRICKDMDNQTLGRFLQSSEQARNVCQEIATVRRQISLEMEVPDISSFNESFWKDYLKNRWDGDKTHIKSRYESNSWREEAIIYYKILSSIYPSLITERAFDILANFETSSEIKPYYDMAPVYSELKQLNKVINIFDLEQVISDKLMISIDSNMDALFYDVEPTDEIIENPQILKDISLKVNKILNKYGFNYVIGDLEILLALQNVISDEAPELIPLMQGYINDVNERYINEI